MNKADQSGKAEREFLCRAGAVCTDKAAPFSPVPAGVWAACTFHSLEDVEGLVGPNPSDGLAVETGGSADGACLVRDSSLGLVCTRGLWWVWQLDHGVRCGGGGFADQPHAECCAQEHESSGPLQATLPGSKFLDSSRHGALN